jgi:transcriptional regulator with XRE-family HTH domain
MRLPRNRALGYMCPVTTPSIEQVGARIRNQRKQLGLSQEALAELLGVSQVTVSSWEKGAKLDHVRLAEIAAALNVTLYALVAPVDAAAEV